MSIATLANPGNTKLGPRIHSWSLPADEKICVGASQLCSGLCYAKKGFFNMPSVEKAYAKNYAFSQTDGFAEWMIHSIAAKMASLARVHPSGEFYDVPYVDKWITIAKGTRRTEYFGYSRAWRDAAILPHLIAFAALPNVDLWWSIDRETGPAPAIKGIKRAYMAINDTDAKTAPNDCDLVFRAKRNTVMKRANGIQVCPPENGVPTKNKITCSSCGICYNTKLPRWEADLAVELQSYGEINVPEDI